MAKRKKMELKASWTDAEVTALIQYLYDHRDEASEGGNFKTSTYTAAAETITLHLKQGPIKTSKMCKGKWSYVC